MTQSKSRTFPSPQRSSVFPFYSHTHFSPAPTHSLTSGHHLSVLHFCNFIISRMLYKWNHAVYNILGLTFSLSIIPLRFIQVVAASIFPFFLLLSSILWYQYITICLTIHSLKNIWITSSLGLLWIKLIWTFTYKFLYEHKFSFS